MLSKEKIMGWSAFALLLILTTFAFNNCARELNLNQINTSDLGSNSVGGVATITDNGLTPTFSLSGVRDAYTINEYASADVQFSWAPLSGPNGLTYNLQIEAALVSPSGTVIASSTAADLQGLSSKTLSTGGVNSAQSGGYRLELKDLNSGYMIYAHFSIHVVSGNYLVMAQHQDFQCTGLGGVLAADALGDQFCRLQMSRCPTGWVQYHNWSTTANTTKTLNYSYSCDPSTFLCLRQRSVTMSVTGHSWADLAAETKSTTVTIDDNGGQKTLTLTADIQEIGCY